MQRGYSANAYSAKRYGYSAQATRKRTVADQSHSPIKSKGRELIAGQLSMCVSRSCEQGMVSLGQYKYQVYNSDFGPLTIGDLSDLTRVLSRTRLHQTVHIPSESKAQARSVCLLACYLIYCKNYSVAQVQNTLGDNYLRSLVTFRDAGIGPDDYPISVVDVLRGL